MHQQYIGDSTNKRSTSFGIDLASFAPTNLNRQPSIPTRVLPQRNAKNTETTTYVVFALRGNPSASRIAAKKFFARKPKKKEQEKNLTCRTRGWTQMNCGTAGS
jgi:hypothetical protein